jgi:hypothetical protein
MSVILQVSRQTGKGKRIHVFLSRHGKNIRVRMLEKNWLRRIFGPNGERMAGGWRKVHIKELHN